MTTAGDEGNRRARVVASMTRIVETTAIQLAGLGCEQDAVKALQRGLRTGRLMRSADTATPPGAGPLPPRRGRPS